MSAYLDKMAAQLYFDVRLRTAAWDEASNDDRDKALAEATRLIDKLNFIGEVASATQLPNQFPRGTDTTVPSDIKNACCEIAIKLLEGFDPDKEAESQMTAVASFATLRKQKDTSITHVWLLAGIPSKIAWDLLFPYLQDPNELVMTRTN